MSNTSSSVYNNSGIYKGFDDDIIDIRQYITAIGNNSKLYLVFNRRLRLFGVFGSVYVGQEYNNSNYTPTPNFNTFSLPQEISEIFPQVGLEFSLRSYESPSKTIVAKLSTDGFYIRVLNNQSIGSGSYLVVFSPVIMFAKQ